MQAYCSEDVDGQERDKCMKKIQKLLAVLILLISTPITCYAAEGENADVSKETSVVQVVVMYSDEDGAEYPVQGGSGFLIGDEQSGAGYMITAREVTVVSAETETLLRELHAVEEEDRVDCLIKAVIRRDIMLDAQLVAESAEMGFAVWKLAQPLHDRETLVLCDETLTGMAGQQATVLGFPTAPQLSGDTVYYTVEEMVSQSGTFIGDGEADGIAYLYHSVTPNAGMLGGPILNKEGNVVAINQSKEAQSGYYALQIAEVLPVLDALGVPYVSAGEVAAALQAELDAIVHKEELQAMIATAEAIDGSLYRSASYKGLIAALETAQETCDRENATQEEVDAAVEMVRAAVNSLEQRPPLGMVIAIISSCILAVALVFVIVWNKTKAGRERKKQQKREAYTVTQAAPVFMERQAQKEDYRQLVTGTSGDLHSGSGPIPQEDFSCGETTVFQQESESSVSNAYLIRKRTGERIEITGREFILGKDPSQTDYCITGNSAISRAHAVIICNGPEYDVADKNATNGTFVNGMKVNAFQKMTLKEGDILKLADEEFEFKR